MKLLFSWIINSFKKNHYFLVQTVNFPKREVKQKNVSSQHLLSTHMVDLWPLDHLYVIVGLASAP